MHLQQFIKMIIQMYFKIKKQRYFIIFRYVMSYSLIMLNTDIHSDKIEKSRKMTRE